MVRVKKETRLPGPELRISDTVKFTEEKWVGEIPDLTNPKAMLLAYQSIHPKFRCQ